MMIFSLKRNLIIGLLTLTTPFIVLGQNGETMFKNNCAACHTVGGGKLVGPDLSGITTKKDPLWLTKFIKNSGEMIKSGDPEAVSIAKEFNNMLMPPYALSDAEIKTILTFIESKGGGSHTSAPAVDILKDVSNKNVISGFQLFTGKQRLKNGGVSCIACHNVQQFGSGGKLAKDLTQSYTTLSAVGIKAMLESPGFPAMQNSYKNNSLTPEEIVDLIAYFRATANNKLPKGISEKSSMSSLFILFGLGGFAIISVFFFILFKSRRTKSVNQNIMDRQMNTLHF